MADPQKLPPHAAAALRHLRRVKPEDGWSADTYLSSRGRRMVRLKRRNVALGDRGGYEDLVHDSEGSGSVVGLTGYVDPVRKYGRGEVLVEAGGEVCRVPREAARVTMAAPASGPSGGAVGVGGGGGAPSAGAQGAAPLDPEAVLRVGLEAISALLRGEALTPDQNGGLARLVLGLAGLALVLRAVLSVLFGLWILILPLAYLYGVQTCPDPDSFDAKRELKRVLRGANLPEDHPDRPRGWLAENLARAAASVTTELAAGLGGYTTTLRSWLGGAVTVATVRVPGMNATCYWVGAFGRWTYVMQREIQPGAGGGGIRIEAR